MWCGVRLCTGMALQERSQQRLAVSGSPEAWFKFTEELGVVAVVSR